MTRTEKIIAHQISNAENVDVQHCAGRKVTIVYKGEFGMAHHVVEARLHFHGTRKWAQYDAATWVLYTPKRKRNPRQYLEGYRPEIVILDGWVAGSVDVPDMWGRPRAGATPDVVVSQARHRSFDSSWSEEADGAVENSGALVLADYRYRPAAA